MRMGIRRDHRDSAAQCDCTRPSSPRTVHAPCCRSGAGRRCRSEGSRKKRIGLGQQVRQVRPTVSLPKAQSLRAAALSDGP